MDQSNNKAAKAIRNNIKKMMEAVSNKDASAFASLFMEDAFMKFPGQEPLEGRNAIKKAQDQMINQGISKLDIETKEIESFGDMAYEAGEYELFVGDGTSIDNGNYITLWKRNGNEWRIYRDLISSSRSPEG